MEENGQKLHVNSKLWFYGVSVGGRGIEIWEAGGRGTARTSRGDT